MFHLHPPTLPLTHTSTPGSTSIQLYISYPRYSTQPFPTVTSHVRTETSAGKVVQHAVTHRVQIVDVVSCRVELRYRTAPEFNSQAGFQDVHDDHVEKVRYAGDEV